MTIREKPDDADLPADKSGAAGQTLPDNTLDQLAGGAATMPSDIEEANEEQLIDKANPNSASDQPGFEG